jgi:hypothetical protein
MPYNVNEIHENQKIKNQKPMKIYNNIQHLVYAIYSVTHTTQNNYLDSASDVLYSIKTSKHILVSSPIK